jgi:hypothetical protein
MTTAPVATLLENIAAYDERRAYLETELLGKWVVFYDRELQGEYDDFQEVADFAVQHFGRGPYLIRKVGQGPITLPASVLWRPNANR